MQTPPTPQADALRKVQARIIRFACICLGIATLAIIGGWALTATLTDWETVAGGLIFLAMLFGFSRLAWQGKRPLLAAWLLAGLLFIIISADVAYYGLGSPSAMAFLIPILLVACIGGLKPGLLMATLASLLVFGVAWASLTGLLPVATLVDESHLSYNAPVISVILLFCGGLAGFAMDVHLKKTQP